MPSLLIGSHVLALAVEREYVIGRSKDCDVCIPDGGLSRRHARFFHRDESWMVEDLDSANGTQVNGKPLVSGPHALRPGDVVTLATRTLTFQGDAVTAAIPAASLSAYDGVEGREVDGYRMEQILRLTTTGALVRAHSLKADRAVMVKILDPRLLERDGDHGRRFTNALTLAAGIRHSGSLRIYHTAVNGRFVWYAFEPATGTPLANHLEAPVPPAASLSVIAGLAEAVHAYHQGGLVHGDLGPRCATIDAGGRVRLTDIGLIGLSAPLRQFLSQQYDRRQVRFCCPHQLSTGDTNVRSDMYGLGCLLVNLLLGKPLFTGSSVDEVLRSHRETPVPALAGTLRLPPLLDQLLTGLLHKDPFYRFEQMQQVIDVLGELRADGRVAAR